MLPTLYPYKKQSGERNMSETPPPAVSNPNALSDSDARLWATLSHAGIILLGILAPLIVWLVFRERSEFVNDQSKEALNFSIIGTIVSVVTCGIGFIVVIIFAIIAAIAANKGENYRYPFNWRVIK